MIDFYGLFAKIILVTVLIGLIRVFLGPTRADRMLAAQLCGTAIVAILLMFSMSMTEAYLIDLALVFSILAAVTSIAFVRLTWQRTDDDKGVESGH